MKENSILPRSGSTELFLIRHAPAATGGKLCGRSDVPIFPLDPRQIEALRNLVDPVTRRIASPALRCRQTAELLWPGCEIATDPRLWEQDFGAWEGMNSADIPDLGPLSHAELARHRPPGGESFADLCARAEPALRALATSKEHIGLLVHAGTIRAALALALRDFAAALAFDIVPLSVTHLTLWPDEMVTIRVVGAGGIR